ncbi:phenylacetate--CoA ligase family protein [Actinoplanes rectilineatus]|uniref:phenylacetate--CoA ligase family protein n=1 Tax=Actinoplanes rectilineatus TaxID=113571 RepID=UPI0005F288DC|nr:AMP-binding protein [Actinoplanes rectilineatus]
MPSTISDLPRLGDWTSFEELAALQAARLPRTLEAAARSPFYRDPLSGGPPPLDALPITTKRDLRQAYPFGLLGVERSRLATYHESSGTAGQPTASYYTDDDWIDLAERFARKWIPIGPDDMFLVRTPYALMITGHLAHRAARMHGATVVPGDNRSLAMPYSRVIRVLHDLDVTLTWSMPAETLIWAAAARLAGLDPGSDFPALRALYVGGEPVTAARRARISRIWGVPVIEEYGSTETGSLAGECPAGHLHFWSDRAIPEIYRPDGTVVAEGSGQLVVTPLYREAMPLLRYNLEDAVELTYRDCECGWHLPTIRVLGRAGAGHPVGRARITQNDLETLVFTLPDRLGVLFWRARAAHGELVVEIEVDEAHRAEAVGALTAAIRSGPGVDAVVRALAPGTLVPHATLTVNQDILKPRTLFGPDEDWDKAILYY